MYGYINSPVCKSELGDSTVRTAIKPVELLYTIPSSQTLVLWLAGMAGTIEWGDGTNKTITATSGTHSKTYSTAGSYKVKIIGDISLLTKFTVSYNTGNSYLACSTFNFAQMTGMQIFGLRCPKLMGDIVCLKNLTQMQTIDFAYSNVTGDIIALKNMTSLTSFLYGSAGLYGDISVFQNIPLTAIGIDTAALSGDISVFAGKNLTYFGIQNSSGKTTITGNISVLSTMVNLTTISAFGVPIYGDLACLENLTKLTLINFGYTNVSNFTPVTLPAFGGECYLVSCPNLTSQNVDDFIIALSANAKNTGNRKLHMFGNTEGRTSASDAAVASLVAKGWQVITNIVT